MTEQDDKLDYLSNFIEIKMFMTQYYADREYDLVIELLEAGVSYGTLAKVYGTSREAVFQRFGKVRKPKWPQPS